MIVITHLFVCDICGNAVQKKRHHEPGFTLEVPHLPYGWELVRGKQICIKHDVKVWVVDPRVPVLR